MNLLQRALALIPAVKSAGNFAPGIPMPLGGWLPSAAKMWNFWQFGYDVQGRGGSAIVDACVQAYAQTVAMCPGTHWRVLENGGRERVSTSALSRILRKPNDYQTISDFMLNLTTGLETDGNAYALAVRNDRFEIEALHLMAPERCGPRIAPDGSLFYALGGNEIVERIFDDIGAREALSAVPARNVLHVKLRTRSSNPLKGESPIMSAAMDDAASNAMMAQSLAFYLNSAKPSGILTTDLPMTADQIKEFREHFNNVTKGLGAGGVPIFSNGMKFQSVSPTSRDSQVVEIMGYTDKRIAAVFRVPQSVLNLGDQGPQGSTEAQMQWWIATGLGFVLNHIEEAIGRMFGLVGMPTEYLEFDTDALLRSQFKDRVEAYARGVQGGIFAPNDARAAFELERDPDGDDVRVQQQVVPLSYGAELQPPTPGATTPALPPPPDDQGDSQDDNQRDFAQLIRAAIDRHSRAVVS